ncbi:MAG: hypothetical protein NTY69_10405 [Methylococcales bacterium]|nr:hypothetical protein [Methylococcales bacterium]
MANQTFLINGPELAKICKQTLANSDNEALLTKIQALSSNTPIRLARTGNDWYRLGGIVDKSGYRIADDLIEWTERTYIECGRDLQTLIDHAIDEKLIATQQKGNTLHLIAQTGNAAADFVQIDIDKIQETADRFLVNPNCHPEDLEEFIDPLHPDCIEAFNIGTARYSYRRKTDVAVFMNEINKYHPEEHPVQRFMDDWNRSSANQTTLLSNDWIIRPLRNTGRFGEQIINVEIINTQQKHVAQFDDIIGKKGVALNNLLTRFDRQIGYPFAWFFYMVKGDLVSLQTGLAVYKDITGDFSYLPERDATILKDWVTNPYRV